MFDADVLVIGGGVVGLWTAWTLALSGKTTVVCDINDGSSVSERNSGVLHAGLYYKKDSLKALHCVRGRVLTEEFLKKYDVPFEICGKLVIGSGPQSLDRLETLRKNALVNGATHLEIIEHPGKLFAGVRGNAALHSKGTGVVDVSAYLRKLKFLCEEAGVIFLPGRKAAAYDGKEVFLEDGKAGERIAARHIVNAAGLYCDDVATMFGLNQYRIIPNRGEYYRLRRPLPFHKLIYPEPPGTGHAELGVHYTFHMNGEAYAGPNSIPAESKTDYTIKETAENFHRSLSAILDGYRLEDFAPGYSGLRPRLFEHGLPVKDFVIREKPAGVWHLLGIESPGLTSAPSLANQIAGNIDS